MRAGQELDAIRPLRPLVDQPDGGAIALADEKVLGAKRRAMGQIERELVERMLKSSGRRVDVSSPFVDAMLPEGHRLHVVLEGISRGFSAVNIRKFLLRETEVSTLRS